jgi:hypothetical protein
MNIHLLIDAIVQQTTVLIAQLATAGGVRAPLAHIATQVFVDLAEGLERQGVSRKVTADMFGISLRSYQRKTQRLRESSTQRGRSLWEAILSYLKTNGVVTLRQILERFHRDEEVSVRGILRDLTETGLIFCSGNERDAIYRLTSEDELSVIQEEKATTRAAVPTAWHALPMIAVVSAGGRLISQLPSVPPGAKPIHYPLSVPAGTP